mmetsp:Transcript_22662/g.43413  ORF Transcript_22662/g.43413 Transcript_22662/m.43413 type:complete len:267 (+) Transcript_22662:578-1378(+)
MPRIATLEAVSTSYRFRNTRISHCTWKVSCGMRGGLKASCGTRGALTWATLPQASITTCAWAIFCPVPRIPAFEAVCRCLCRHTNLVGAGYKASLQSCSLVSLAGATPPSASESALAGAFPGKVTRSATFEATDSPSSEFTTLCRWQHGSGRFSLWSQWFAKGAGEGLLLQAAASWMSVQATCQTFAVTSSQRSVAAATWRHAQHCRSRRRNRRRSRLLLSRCVLHHCLQLGLCCPSFKRHLLFHHFLVPKHGVNILFRTSLVKGV